MTTENLRLKDIIGAYKESVASGAFVTTESIVIASALKNESFEKARSHFNSHHTMLAAFTSTLIKLDAMVLSMRIAEVTIPNTILADDIEAKGNPIGIDPLIKQSVGMFTKELDFEFALMIQKIVQNSTMNHIKINP